MPAEAAGNPRSAAPVPRQRRRLRNIRRPRIGALFWWTIAIIVLGICAVLSWFASIYIFNHPNQPVPYRILTKLGKLEPLQRFPSDAPPSGKFRVPRDLMDLDYEGFGATHLEYLNGILLRDYLENYRRSEGVAYVKGEFIVEHVRALGPDDLFQQGLVWRGRTEEFPNASVELILPTAGPVDPEHLALGETFTISGSYFAAVVHAARPDDRTMCFTLVPIAYGNREIGSETRIELRPPSALNLKGRWPLTSPEDVDPAHSVTAGPEGG